VSKMPAMTCLRSDAGRHAGRALCSCAATALLLILFVPVVLAQTPAAEPRPAIIISGKVRDISGVAIADATVFLKENASGASVEGKSGADGSFSFLALRAGKYVVTARKQGFREAASEPMDLSPGQKKQIELVLSPQPGNLGATNETPASAGASKSGATSAPMQFDDKPNFTVAGVTDWTNVGGHGSDTKLRTSESLAKETAALKSSSPAETPAPAAISPGSADSHRLAGDRAERAGDPLAAVHEYEEAVRLNPSEENYFAWGAELLQHRAVKPAAEVFEKGTTAHRKSARMLAGLGAALYASGSYEDAARRLCAAADLQPTDPTPYLFLGKMEKSAPDPLPCAEQKLARFAHDQPANALANYYYAVSLWKRARGSANSATLHQIEALLQKAAAADPKLDEALIQLGAVYAAKGDSQQAVSAYKKAIEVNPQSGEAHYRLALAYKRAGEEEKSEQELQLYKQADKTETAAIEQQRREIRQFLIILKDQPQSSAPQPEKQR
jgi:tetratricopeptide (TPR) repeat protein